MLPTSMAARNSPARSFIIFSVCAAALAGGLWYARGGTLGWWEDEQDVDDDDDEEPADLRPDAGAPRRRPKKSAPRLSAPRPKKKPSEARQARTPVARPPENHPPHAGPKGPSYESAIAGNVQNLAPGTKEAPDLTDGELAGPLRDGTFLDTCGVPGSTKVTVKVAIRNGHSVGISVYSAPPSQEIAGCVEEHVRGLQWPSNAKMDSFVTTY